MYQKVRMFFLSLLKPEQQFEQVASMFTRAQAEADAAIQRTMEASAKKLEKISKLEEEIASNSAVTEKLNKLKAKLDDFLE